LAHRYLWETGAQVYSQGSLQFSFIFGFFRERSFQAQNNVPARSNLFS
jgi:hypothetical protein